MGKRVLSRGIPGLAVALGVTALVVLLLYGGGEAGLTQGLSLSPQAYLPLVMKGYPPPLLEDHFDTDANNWTPFLNDGRLVPEQWYWEAGTGYTGGGYRHNRYGGGKDAHDALSMYLQGDSQTWTDYSFQARVIIREGEAAGLWFRGTYSLEDPPVSGRKVGGYYFIMRGTEVILWQIQTENDCISPSPCDKPWYLWHFSNPRELASVSRAIEKNKWHTLKVEVQGARIKCYLDGQLLIDYDDSPTPGKSTVFLEGTVGFKTYKCGNVVFDDVLVTSLP